MPALQGIGPYYYGPDESSRPQKRAIAERLLRKIFSGRNDTDYFLLYAGIFFPNWPRPIFLSSDQLNPCAYPAGHRFLNVCRLTERNQVGLRDKTYRP